MKFFNSSLTTWIGVTILLGAVVLAFLYGLAKDSLRCLKLMNELGGRRRVFKQSLVAALVGVNIILFRQDLLVSARNGFLVTVLTAIWLVLFFPIYYPAIEKLLIGNPEFSPPRIRQIILRFIFFCLIALTLVKFYF